MASSLVDMSMSSFSFSSVGIGLYLDEEEGAINIPEGKKIDYSQAHDSFASLHS